MYKFYLFLMLIGPLLGSCHNANDSIKLNVDRNIPPSEDFDASYGFWGPNGNKIYFQHSDSLGTNPDPGRLDELWELNILTGQRHLIHSGRILNADISPDSKWFVFHSFTDPQFMYKMKSDGTDLQKLTGSDSLNPDWRYTVMGKWSPDGSKILFAVEAGIHRGVSLMDSNGTHAHIIIPYGVQPNWSPNESHIIYLNWDLAQPTGQQLQIYIADSTGYNAKKITDLNQSDDKINSPSISPDGKWVVFTYTGVGSNSEVFIMKVDGSDIEQITEGSGYVRRPEWSPDGKTILFSRIIDNVSDRLYYLDVTTHQVTPVFPAKKP